MSRAVEHLRAVVAVDRKAVELAETRLAQLRSLFEAGRIGAPDLQAAERESVDLKERLLRHQQELADAQLDAAAEGAPRRR